MIHTLNIFGRQCGYHALSETVCVQIRQWVSTWFGRSHFPDKANSRNPGGLKQTMAASWYSHVSKTVQKMTWCWFCLQTIRRIWVWSWTLVLFLPWASCYNSNSLCSDLTCFFRYLSPPCPTLVALIESFSLSSHLDMHCLSTTPQQLSS